MTSKETRHLSAEQIAEFEAQKKAAKLHGDNIHKLAARLVGKTPKIKKSLCVGCQINKKQPMHSCPYNDSKECNCCDDCHEGCHQDS